MSEHEFQNRPLGNAVAVGAAEPRACRLWMRFDQPGRYTLEVRSNDSEQSPLTMPLVVEDDNPHDNTLAVQVPPADGEPLEPMTRYTFRVTRDSDGQLIGDGQYETSPAADDDMPDQFSIALLSCNQPFADDGSYDPTSSSMVRAAREAMRRHNCKMLFTVGDQMYADLPRPLSLFNEDHFRRVAPPGREKIQDCTGDETRRLYHRRYRHFFASDEWRALQTSFPCYPIFDDHEIIDNWGSAPEHQESEWQSVWQGARAAYFDYQGSRVLDGLQGRTHLGYEVVYGPFAGYVVDLRSNRRSNGDGLLSDEQLEIVEQFLHQHADKEALFFVLSVPAVHLPRWASYIASKCLKGVEDFSDRWSSPAHVADRDRFLKLVHEHQRTTSGQPVILLSGDIHIGCVHQIRWNDGAPPLYQIISSPISHQQWWLENWAAKMSIQMNRRLTTRDEELRASIRRMPAEHGGSKNPFVKLNLGLIDFKRVDQRWEIRLLLYGHDGNDPVCVYRSKPITASHSARQIQHHEASQQCAAS